jgi:hypothetical protein
MSSMEGTSQKDTDNKSTISQDSALPMTQMATSTDQPLRLNSVGRRVTNQP